MGSITWNDHFSVKVKQIDKQHQQLFLQINELHTAMKTGKATDVLQDILIQLTEYIEDHFSTEEMYFDKYQYEDSAAHKREHKGFVKEVDEFKKDQAEGKWVLSLKMSDFLTEWLCHHILESDKKYSACFNKNGLF